MPETLNPDEFPASAPWVGALAEKKPCALVRAWRWYVAAVAAGGKPPETFRRMAGSTMVTKENKMAKNWRQMLTELGGWDNELLSVPAGTVREIIEEVEALRLSNAAAKVGANVAARPDNLLIDVGALLAGFVEEGLPMKRGEARQVLERVRKARLAAGAPAETPKPVYLVRYTSIEGWRVAGEEAYWTFSECNRRILYEAAQPTPAPIAGDVEKDAVSIFANPERLKTSAPAAVTRRDLGPSCTCSSDDGSLRWPCPVHPK